MRVLIVEDEALVSMMLSDYLIDLDHIPICAESVQRAIQIIENDGIDAAVLDVNLSGENAYPVADRLIQVGIPFGFATGYGKCGVDPIYHRFPILAKPFNSAAVEDLANKLAA